MIVEATHNAAGQWEVSRMGDFWGCVCNSTTKEGATKIIAMNFQERPNNNAHMVSRFYGFISDVSRQELVDEAESRGLELDLPDENLEI